MNIRFGSSFFSSSHALPSVQGSLQAAQNSLQGDSVEFTSQNKLAATSQLLKFGLNTRSIGRGIAIDGIEGAIPFPEVVDGLSDRTMERAASILELATLMDRRTPFVRGVHPSVRYPITELDGPITYTNGNGNTVNIRTVVPGIYNHMGLKQLQKTPAGMRRTYGYSATRIQDDGFGLIPLVKPAVQVSVRENNGIYTTFLIDPTYPDRPEIIAAQRYTRLETGLSRLDFDPDGIPDIEKLAANRKGLFWDPDTYELKVQKIQPLPCPQRVLDRLVQEVFETFPNGIRQAHQGERGVEGLGITVDGNIYSYGNSQLFSLANQYRMDLGEFRPDEELTLFRHSGGH